MSAGMVQGGTPAVDSPEQVANVAVPATKRFAAFLSYAHVDQAVADRLHKQIETYRLPKRLRAADGGEAAVRLGSVFRDRADLAAADSLSDAIRAALAESGALIVLCSPAAVQSRWVNEEVRLFRVLNPGAPVLAAVVRGEPADAMPAALTEDGREPLAADLREEGDGRKLGFLKIVAALAGVPLDALIQRDAQRNLRRVMAVTVGALLALVAAVSMMTYAIQQRNEAQAQRAEAERRRAQSEGLVEFMLTDLRERLRGVGRIDIMRSAVGSALDSYGGDGAIGELHPDSQGQLARLLHAVGEDALSAGNQNEARRAILRAHAITGDLLDEAPQDADRIFNHAQSEFWAGRLQLGEPGNATRRHWQSYRQMADRLRTVEPRSQRSLQELAYADGNLCSLQLMENRNGVTLCRAALASQRRLAEASPRDSGVAITLANRLAWLADAMERSEGLGSGEPYRQEQLSIARRLSVQEPSNWELREFLVRALIASGSAANSAGDGVLAEQRFAEARGLLDRMQRHDPANRVWSDLAAMIN